MASRPQLYPMSSTAPPAEFIKPNISCVLNNPTSAVFLTTLPHPELPLTPELNAYHALTSFPYRYL